MTNPIHRVKKFVKYAGNDKPASNYITDYCGWLVSEVKDKDGFEICEGDKVIFGERELHGVITFKDASFGISYKLDGTEKFIPLAQTIGFVDIEIVGHIAEDEP